MDVGPLLKIESKMVVSPLSPECVREAKDHIENLRNLGFEIVMHGTGADSFWVYLEQSTSSKATEQDSE